MHETKNEENNKKNVKRILIGAAIVILVIIILLLLHTCGKGDSSNGADTDSGTVQETDEPTESTYDESTAAETKDEETAETASDTTDDQTAEESVTDAEITDAETETPEESTPEAIESVAETEKPKETAKETTTKAPAITKAPETTKPSESDTGKVYHTEWGTRPHEFEEAYVFSYEKYDMTFNKSFKLGYIHTDLYGNAWYDYQQHSDGLGKYIYNGTEFIEDTIYYFGDGNWCNCFSYWSEYGDTSIHEVKRQANGSIGVPNNWNKNPQYYSLFAIKQNCMDTAFIINAYHVLDYVIAGDFSSLEEFFENNHGDMPFTLEDCHAVGLYEKCELSEFTPISNLKAPNKK